MRTTILQRLGLLAALLPAMLAAACSHKPRPDATPPLAAQAPAAAAAEAARLDPQAGPALTTAEQVEHVLSRVTFGARPGDRERVARLGVASFLEEQLHPERIDDSALEAKLADLRVLRRSTAELSQELTGYRKMKKEEREAAARAEEKRAAAPQAALEAKPGAEAAPPSAMTAGPDATDGAAAMAAREVQVSEDPTPAPAAKPPEANGGRPRTKGLRKALGKLGRGPGFDFTVELAEAKLARAVYSERQLQELMADFWFNHFNVFAGKDREAALLPEYEREAIRAHALGTFPELLQATAHSAAMLIYLDNWRSSSGETPLQLRPYARNRVKPKKRGQGLNENYARELLELHTLGVDGGYTQADVTEVARCFTGWTVEDAEKDPRYGFKRKLHDEGVKHVLGQVIPAGGGERDGERVLQLLLDHPSTARFLATKLVRRFVSDEPPAELVEQVAAAYRSTGGDIRSMLRAIFASPAFWSRRALKAKMRSPLELVAGSIRALGATVEEPLALVRAVARIGEPLYAAAPPTGYGDTESAWATSGALLARIDFGLQLAAGQLDGVEVDLASLSLDAHAAEEVLDRAAARLGAGALSENTRSYVLAQLAEVRLDRKPEQVAQRAVGLLLGAPELQRR